jgi:phosphate transport system permease protein
VSITTAPSDAARARARARRRLQRADRVGERLLRALCLLAAGVTVVTIVAIAWQVLHGASGAISKTGPGFLVHSAWRPSFDVFGATVMLYGTAVSSLMALVLALPIGIAVGLYLSLLAPRGVRGVVGPLVEMLAAIPSVILGFWGIVVLGPFLQAHVEPWLHARLGFLPLFGPPATTGASIFTAGLILTIMVVPIIASISRDLFQTVPRDLKDGAEALGATRWEVVRGVVLPSTASGIAAAACLGLGRALGEAIAVTQVIGAATAVHINLFGTGETAASRIANQFQSPVSRLHTSAMFYLAVLLLAIGLLTNLLAQWIGRRFDVRRVVAA